MRFTQVSGRGNKLGVYLPGHHDRDFNTAMADNIDCERTPDNVYYGRTSTGEFVRYYHWDIDTDTDLGHIPRFEEQESLIYERKFKRQYHRQMLAYRKKGNHDRIKDFDTWRKCKRYCPEEVIYQVGKVGNSPQDEQEEIKCYDEIVQKLLETGEEYGYILLNCAIHMDESGVPHLHARRVWFYTDADGVECIGQEKALEQAGVALPEPEEKPGRYNNRKMTFDAEMRENVIEIAKNHGYEIETEPVKDAKHNRSKEQYLKDLAFDMMQAAQAHEKALDEREQELLQLFDQLDAAAKAALAPKVDALRARRLPTTPGDQPDQPQPTGPETGF